MGFYYIFSICLAFSTHAFFSAAKAEDDRQEVGDISKRHLRWQGQTIKPDTASSLRDIQVKYFIPHPNSAQAVDTAAFTGFTIYERNGMLNNPPNAGIFAFVSTANAMAGVQQGNCIPTMHAGAYYHIYRQCPEDDTEIVASGHCRVGGELRFNSGTFNQYVGRNYLFKEYYLNNDRAMNPIEQDLFKPCIQKWANNGYPTAGWDCEIEMNAFTAVANDTQRRISKREDTCDPCGAVCDGGANHISLSVPVFAIAIALTWASQ